MSGEHGDGLARSLWNRKLFGPEVYSAFQAIKRGFRPAKPAQSRQSRRRCRSGRKPPHRPGLSPARARRDIARLFGAGGVCRRRRDVLGRRRLPQEFRRHDVPELHGHARRDAHHSRASQPASARDDRRAAFSRRGIRQRSPSRSARPLPAMQGLQDRMPVKGRYGQAQGRSAPSAIPWTGPIRSVICCWATFFVSTRSRPRRRLWPTACCAIRAFKWLLEKTAGIDRRRTLPTFARDNFRRWFRRHVPRAGAGTRGEVVLLDDCFTTYNEPEVGIATVRVLEAAGYRIRLAGLQCCGRPAISKGLLPLARELARANVRKTTSLRSQPARQSWAASQAAW